MTKNDEITLRSNVLIAFQVALLGMITSSLRGVTVNWDSMKITAEFFYDCDIGDEEFEITNDIEGEICASFPDHEVKVIACLIAVTVITAGRCVGLPSSPRILITSFLVLRGYAKS